MSEKISKEEFSERWKKVRGIVWPLAVSLFQTFPKKEFDPEETAEDRQKRSQEKWLGLNRIHGQVVQLCQEHGLQMLTYPFNYLNDEEEPSALRDWWYRTAYYESVDDPAWIGKVDEPPMPLVKINAPGWFSDPKFLEWLNAPRTATWHTAGEAPDDYSDVFFTFCDGDGSDSPCGGDERPHIPEPIWNYIEYAVNKELGMHNECLVWVTNLEI